MPFIKLQNVQKHLSMGHRVRQAAKLPGLNDTRSVRCAVDEVEDCSIERLGGAGTAQLLLEGATLRCRMNERSLSTIKNMASSDRFSAPLGHPSTGRASLGISCRSGSWAGEGRHAVEIIGKGDARRPLQLLDHLDEDKTPAALSQMKPDASRSWRGVVAVLPSLAHGGDRRPWHIMRLRWQARERHGAS